MLDPFRHHLQDAGTCSLGYSSEGISAGGESTAWHSYCKVMARERIPLTTPDLDPETDIICATRVKASGTKIGKLLYGEST